MTDRTQYSDESEYRPCELCEGDGTIPALVDVPNGDGTTGQTVGDVICPDCGGRG